MTAPSGRILLDNRSADGHAYVEIFADKTVKAGYYPDTARRYSSVQAAYDHFRAAFEASNSHSSWNICYALEDYLPHKGTT